MHNYLKSYRDSLPAHVCDINLPVGLSQTAMKRSNYKSN